MLREYYGNVKSALTLLSLLPNEMNHRAIRALTTKEEYKTIVMLIPIVKLKRTFTQDSLNGEAIKFWRVVYPPTHPNFGSDLSKEGLKDWGIL